MEDEYQKYGHYSTGIMYLPERDFAKYRFRNPGNQVRMLMIGKRGVGKSSLIMALTTGTFSDSNDYASDEYYTLSYKTSRGDYTAEIKDIRDFNFKNYKADLKSTIDVVHVIFSVIDRDSFQYALEVLNELKPLRHSEDGMPFVYLVGTKTDAVNKDNFAASVKEKEAKEAAFKRHASAIFVSAKLIYPVKELALGCTMDLERLSEFAANEKDSGSCSSM